MSETKRNLMLKNQAPLNSREQHHSTSLPLFRGAGMISQLETQKHPTSFVPCSSDFDNNIIPAAPVSVMPQNSSSSEASSSS
ncbi:unnamed protein product [Caenorhabditis sp. 36 PRJEB53466]|nr:unnamed protein product [Caenorhabditis sp. 36 PRJEB53466]